MPQPRDEEDLDDLDDVLDQFTPAPPKSQSTLIAPPTRTPEATTSTAQSSSSKSPPWVPLPDTDELMGGITEDFARELAKGMESLMRESEDTTGKDDFQTTIKQAMETLKESESALKAESDPSNPNADPFEALLAQLGAGDESEEALDGLLETMMNQLMNKEVLYEPLKELHDKFPSYVKDHPELAAEDKRRYQLQYRSISKIMALFDDPAYKDGDPRVVEFMTEMQSFGSPPPEIMGPMPPGFGFGPDGTPRMPEGCILA